MISHIARRVGWVCGWFGFGALLTALAYQIPALHRVEVGHNDAAYVQGFEEPANRWGVVTDETGVETPFRWSSPESALIFPQIGLPARVTLRVRGWRPPGAESPRVRVLLNSREELGSFVADGSRQEHSFLIQGGLWKPRDLFLQLTAEPALEQDGRQRGVQVDQAILETRGWPITPYPAQLLGGAVATLLAAILFRKRPRVAAALAVGMCLLFLVCYRLGIWPYPPRLFWPGLNVTLGAAIIIQRLPDLRMLGLAPGLRLRTRNQLLSGMVALLVVAWLAGTWWAGRSHVVLSMPGVEKDFRVFATRSEQLWCPAGANLADAGCVLRADGFYQLGYPLLLWLARPLTLDNAFLAGQFVALGSGALLLTGSYLLGRRLLGVSGGIVALLLVLLNRWSTEYSLYLGTDMPFAALWTLALVALLGAGRSRWGALLAGLLGGAAFLIRHPGILLLPLGIGYLLWRDWDDVRLAVRRRARLPEWAILGSFVLGFCLASLPQVVVNVTQTGHLLYSQQAKNIWLAVYGNTDWGRWAEARDNLTLADVVRHDPTRFLRNWWGNIRGFWGTGGEDTSEFGRGLAMRLLTFPANLLTWGGLLLWLLQGDRRQRLALIAGFVYITTVAVGFMLPRFALPLVPIWAVMAAAAAGWLWRAAVAKGVTSVRLVAAAGFAALILMAGAPMAGLRTVLGNQDAEAVAAVHMLARALPAGEGFEAQLPPEDMLAKYSSVAHLAGRDASPRYLLTSDQPPASLGEPVAQAGRYVLYLLDR